MISSIPRSIPNNTSEKAPHHQPTTPTTSPAASACDDNASDTSNNNWVYPSEQQFFNAMKRKGWQLPPGSEVTMPQVVQIHNAVNERGWSQIIQWERMRGNDEPKLVRFLGRPSDKSPRALWNEWILMKKAPFDRHDWYVVHGQNEEIPERRYVIDFYNGKESTSERGSNVMGASMDPTQMENRPPSMFLDVRPALDDADAVRDRTKMFCKEALPGLFSLWQTYQSQSLLNNSPHGSSTSSGISSSGGNTKETNGNSE
jgi:cytochrome c heme-lyase